MARILCTNCHYPEDTCICHAVRPFHHQTKILLLQHPSEINNKKNTVRLLSLACNHLQVYTGESDQDFNEVKKLVAKHPHDFALLYPSEKAIAINLHKSFPGSEEKSRENSAPGTLIVLDGTWRKAKKLLLLNPWLLNIKHLSLAPGVKSQYGIRKTSVDGGLSTLEAVAYSLAELEALDASPLLHLLEAFKSAFTSKMPKNVKARY